MRVQLLDYTRNPELTVARAAKCCYSDSDIDTLCENMSQEEIEKYIEMLCRSGHMSPFEHANFTFAIEGVSRAMSHQLVRHRIASYSQQSQRYVDMCNFEYNTPASIEQNEKFCERFHNLMYEISVFYDDMVEEGIPKEDARAILPNATQTRLVMTMNARSLHNLFYFRCCNRAQEEIREVADGMLQLVRNVAPALFKVAGPSCITEGKCHEHKSCGKPRVDLIK